MSGAVGAALGAETLLMALHPAALRFLPFAWLARGKVDGPLSVALVLLGILLVRSGKA